jgi:protein tyrosine/serine phosphatase
VQDRRRVIIAVLVTLALAGGVTGGLVWHHKTSPKHFLTVEPGVLYRSGRLRTHNLEKVLDEYGIRTVVNLRDPLYEQRRVCQDRGVRVVDLPMRPETPPSEEQLEQWLALLDDPESRPILVHCEHGVVRTGMMVAIFEMEYARKDNRDALSDLPMFRSEPDVPERMREFILNYEPRWKGAPPTDE